MNEHVHVWTYPCRRSVHERMQSSTPGTLLAGRACARTHRHTCALTQADLIERVLEMKFLPGHNPEITSIRLTIDPIYAAQRPLVYYAAISLLHALGAVGVGLLGFERRYVLGQTFLFRSACADSQAPRTAPIIFCHGLGIGFLHYLRVLRQLPSSSDVYLLESPNITMSLGAETQRSIADTQALVRAMLHADGHSSACLVAHSFGTIVPSWLLTARDPSLGALVESVVLIDPISLLLYDPAVAYNFVHRTPATAVEIMMSYFVSQVSKQQTHAPARTSTHRHAPVSSSCSAASLCAPVSGVVDLAAPCSVAAVTGRAWH